MIVWSLAFLRGSFLGLIMTGQEEKNQPAWKGIEKNSAVADFLSGRHHVLFLRGPYRCSLTYYKLMISVGSGGGFDITNNPERLLLLICLPCHTAYVEAWL